MSTSSLCSSTLFSALSVSLSPCPSLMLFGFCEGGINAGLRPGPPSSLRQRRQRMRWRTRRRRESLSEISVSRSELVCWPVEPPLSFQVGWGRRRRRRRCGWNSLHSGNRVAKFQLPREIGGGVGGGGGGGRGVTAGGLNKEGGRAVGRWVGLPFCRSHCQGQHRRRV